jgi:peptidoglycan/LPS O-acetylase OafA/YrhL
LRSLRAWRERLSVRGPAGFTERLPGLDLLRAVAILVVALHHADAAPEILGPIQRFGWMGVDLFFVLSGYLIGSQLLRPYARGLRPSLREFYFRRAFRILPAFLVVLAAYYLVPSLREVPNMAPLSRFLTFTMNLGFNRSEGAAFSHAWSLCVEEYFYLLFPLMCVLLMYQPSLKRAVVVIALVAIAGLLVRFISWVYLVGPVIHAHGAAAADTVVYPEYIYYPTYTRLDGLLIGVTVASIKVFRPAWWDWALQRGHSLEAVGLVLTGGAIWLCIDRTSMSASVFGFPLLSLGLGLLLASSLSANGVLARLRLPGVGLIATLAYCFYLTHKEIMHLDRVFVANWLPLDGGARLLIYAATCFAAAYVLHVAVERPFLRMRERHVADRAGVAAADRRSALQRSF